VKVDRSRAALLVVDIQDRLWQAMSEEDRAACERNVKILIALAAQLGLPVVQSEQYPKGLGPTVPAVAAALEMPNLDLRKLEKMEFSCAAAPGWPVITGALRERDQWIVVGMETHVCVYQTARDLALAGAEVFVPADAVVSRTRENKRIGLELIAREGGVITATEVVVFDALERAGTDEFKAMSKLVK
jgi:isochorismate hydrolase